MDGIKSPQKNIANFNQLARATNIQSYMRYSPKRLNPQLVKILNVRYQNVKIHAELNEIIGSIAQKYKLGNFE